MEPEKERRFSAKPLISPEYIPSLEKFVQSNNRRMGEKLAILTQHKTDTLKVLDETSDQI